MCMSDLLTVAEYSKARNCSVSAVYKRLKSPSNNIHNFKVIIDGTTYLKREILVAEGLISQDPAATEPGENPSTTSNEVVEEVDRLAEVGFDNMTAREKAYFKVLAEHRQKTERQNELSKIGVTEEYSDLLLKGIENIIDML